MRKTFSLFFILLAAFWIYRENGFVPKKVMISGDLSAPQRMQLENKLLLFQDENFLLLDFSSIEESVQQLSWVDRVEVSKVWPRTLRLDIVKSSLIARWNNDAYLSSSGELIYMSEGSIDLPKLRSISYSTQQILQYFRLFQQYAKREGLDMIGLEETKFGDWRLTFRSGWHLLLRSDFLEDKMESFLKVYRGTLKQKKEALVRVDGRYDNAFAIKFASVSDEK